MGPNGIRAGWRFLIFMLLIMGMSMAVHFFRKYVMHVPARGMGGGMDPVTSIWRELRGLIIVVIAALIMAKIEREKWDHYGMPARRLFSGDFLFGLFWGFAALSAVMGGLWLAGAYRIDGLALGGFDIWKYGFLWAVMFLLVGLMEEFSTRGYPLYTLASGMGFWPAAIFTSALFFAGHLGNPGETWMGLSDVFIIGVFFCLTVWRTGDLWFAIGLHGSWDWGLTYFYSVPNSGTTATGHLFNIHTQGPRWLSGGEAGPEGSIINLVFDLLWFVIFIMIYRRRKWVGMNDRRRAAQTQVAQNQVVIDSTALNG